MRTSCNIKFEPESLKKTHYNIKDKIIKKSNDYINGKEFVLSLLTKGILSIDFYIHYEYTLLRVQSCGIVKEITMNNERISFFDNAITVFIDQTVRELFFSENNKD